MKYEVGDKVLIKSLDWYNENKNPKHGFVYFGHEFCFYSHMSKYCGKTLTISEIVGCCYVMAECVYDNWTDEMIEGLVRRIGEGTCSFAEGQESHTKPSSELYKEHIENMNKETNKIISNAVAGDMLAEKTMLDCILAKGLLIPNGYEIKDENGNVINATKIVLEKKKKEYPNNFYHCVRTLGLYSHPADASKYKPELIRKFQTLLICRDAYWKIAGDEMGLGKPWEPDWVNLEQDKHCIWVDVGDIILNEGYRCQHILTFPTKEMRDAFYEAFKEDIEECKELL